MPLNNEQTNSEARDVFCVQVYQYTINVTVYASVYTLVLMSLDRYLVVVYPMESVTIRTERNASILAVLSWVVILCGNAPVVQEHGAIEYQFADGQTRSACMNYVIYAADIGDGQVSVQLYLEFSDYSCLGNAP